METKAVTRVKPGWPSMFENKTWLDKFFNSPLDEYFDANRMINVPAVNVHETPENYILNLAAPGLEKKDFHVQVEDGMMTISAEREETEKDQKNGKFNRREYNYSSWSRSFTLPEDADDAKIKAEYKNGELKIALPRTGKKLKYNVKNISVE